MPTGAIAPFSLLVKPAGPDCNLRCRYCFYLGKAGMFPGARHRMDTATLEAMARDYLAMPFPTHSFAWQGGEPTLMGVDFFRRAVAFQRRYARPGGRIVNVLQTNATLIDDEFARFLAEANFLVGVSIDGTRAIHDASRVDASGAPSYDRVVAGIDALRRNGVAFNALVLVSKANASRPEEVYRHIRDDLGIKDHQYIECADADAEGCPLPHSIGAEDWGAFLCGLFDAWAKRDTHRVSVRLFDTVKTIALTGRSPVCAHAGECSGYMVVEHNGDIFPCDFHVQPEWRLGNILEGGLASAAASPLRAAFGARKARLPAECEKCEWLRFCRGDCPRNRSPLGACAGGSATAHAEARSRLCAGWRRFFAHAASRLAEMAKDELAITRAPSRNDPCPCGSGRKYKHCCGRHTMRA